MPMLSLWMLFFSYKTRLKDRVRHCINHLRFLSWYTEVSSPNVTLDIAVLFLWWMLLFFVQVRSCSHTKPPPLLKDFELLGGESWFQVMCLHVHVCGHIWSCYYLQHMLQSFDFWIYGQIQVYSERRHWAYFWKKAVSIDMCHTWWDVDMKTTIHLFWKSRVLSIEISWCGPR